MRATVQEADTACAFALGTQVRTAAVAPRYVDVLSHDLFEVSGAGQEPWSSLPDGRQTLITEDAAVYLGLGRQTFAMMRVGSRLGVKAHHLVPVCLPQPLHAMRRTLGAAAGGLLFVLGCGRAGRGPLSEHPQPPTSRVGVDLERSGDGYAIFRIPALAVTRRGTLIAAYDGRPTMGDLPSHISVLVRRSADGGRTWQARQVVRSDTAPLGFGDPSALVDRITGRVFLFYAASVRQGFVGSRTGNDPTDADVLQADCSWSDDDGVTWRHRRLTAAIKDPAWGGMFASSGAGIQLVRGPHAGRLIQQYVVRFHGGNYGASAWSDDHGDTWHMGSLVGPGVDENKVVELADGRLLLNSRARGYRRVATSIDGGATWTDLHDERQLVDPANNGSIVRYNPRASGSNPQSHWLLFSNTAHPAERVNLTVKLSCDDGATWAHEIRIEPGAAAYSTLAVLPDGSVGLLYERGNYEYMTFQRFTVNEFGRGCRGP